MKKILLFTLCVVFSSSLWGAGNVASLERNIEKNVHKKRISSVLSMILEVEEPTEYQREEMIKLEHALYQAAKDETFQNFSQLAKFLDEHMPASEYDTILIKDAFPTKPGAKPKGSLDCDGRTLFTLGVLERLRKPFKVYAVSQVDHMLLSDGKLFYDLLYKDYGREADKNEWSYSFPLLTKKEIYGHLLANKALFLWKGGGERFYPEQLPFIEKGFEIARESYRYNPKNLSLIFNWYKFRTDDPQLQSSYSFPQIIDALGILLGRAESTGLKYEPLVISKDFYLETTPESSVLKEKIQKVFLLNEWIAYTLQRIGNLYGLHAEKYLLEIYMSATGDISGGNQRAYACVLHMLGHPLEEVLANRKQSDEKFNTYLTSLKEEELDAAEIFYLNMTKEKQVDVTDEDFLNYCKKNFRSR